MNRLQKIQALRDEKTTHYNCCQSILIPFAEELGLSEQQAFALGANLGGGLRYGATCGALVAGLIVLGALGDDERAPALIEQFRAAHNATDCTPLLEIKQQQGAHKKEYCDALVAFVGEYLETLTAQG